MPEKVFVTGLGIISAIGRGVEETIAAIEEGRSGIGKLELLDTQLAGVLPAAEVRFADDELAVLAGLEERGSRSRAALLAVHAVREALANAGITSLREERTGLVSGNSAGGMSGTEQFFRDFLPERKHGGDLRDVLGHECSDSTDAVAALFGVTEHVTTISTACSSGANAVMLGARLIRNGILDRAIVGGCDALCRFTLNGFNSLLILDKDGCRPFDRDRKGTTLGEGAGYLVLESAAAVARHGKLPLCEVSGWANTCDAYHQTASSPEGEGAYAAMAGAIARAGIRPEDISYVNAHGTGTANNDLSEGKAIDRLFGGTVPAVSSTKAFTGHTLGAAGGIESVLAALSIARGILWPNKGFSTKMEELSFTPHAALTKQAKVEHVLKNSFGFGGNNTSLVFSRCS